MKVGVNLINFGPGITPDSIGRWGQTVEALGYHGVFISDHVAITESVSVRYPEPYYDALITLSWLAARTTRIDLGTTVIVLPYRHPVLLARHVANLDLLSGGRAILGVGIGNAQDEFAALGVPHNRRGAWSDDAIEAVKALWTGTGLVSYAGKHIQFDSVSAIRPRQEPHPPIWVGGNSESGMRRAIRHGASWHPINQPVARLRDELVPWLVAEAERLDRPVPPLAPRIRLRLTEEPLGEATRAPGTGTIEQVRNDLRGLEQLGSEYVVLDWYNGPDDLDGTRDHEHAFAMLARLADEALDLGRQTTR